MVIRPPASMAHYHNPEAEYLLKEVVNGLSSKEHILVVIVPRTDFQREEMKEKFKKYGNVHIMEMEVDGISMLKDADLVISGGGTMNREAALLGKPVYSIFQGRKGLVDRWLEEEGRLRFLSKENSKIEFGWKNPPLKKAVNLKKWLVHHILLER